MATIFPKSADKYVKIIGGLLAAGLLGGVGLFAYYLHPQVVETRYQPLQPVPFSHKLHAGDLGLNCHYCHSTVYKAAYAAVPATETCMNCHARVKTQSPRLIKVRESYASGEPIPWVHVHVLPDYVYFNHAAHVNAGVSCVSCHGRVDQMPEVRQMKPLNMAWCLECHRNPAPNLRPAKFVTDLAWQPDRDPVEMGQEIMREKHIHPPTNCSGCHR